MTKHTKEEANMDEVRHSLSHLLAAVVLKKYPGTKIGIGPTIENGFYYDFLLPAPISDADLLDLQKEMRHLIAQKLDFTKEEITAAKAKKLFAGQNFKLELIEELEKAKSLISLYITGNIFTPSPERALSKNGSEASDALLVRGFTDLCKGPHVKNTSEINMEGFKLTHIAGAYWKGSEKNQMLTRIYGLAFANKKELDAHLLMLLEAKKRDHRLLGEKLKIFAFSDFVGPGLPLWLPNGTVIIEELEKMAKEMERRAGYKRVRTPHIAKEIMYTTSGHLPYYAESNFPPMIIDEDGQQTKYYLKSMNCPHHHQIFAAEPKSYRQLPIRLAEYGTCYRYEKSGELFGLMRVRMLSMNDAHIYCTEEQFADEFMGVIKMYLEYFKIFGIEKYVMRFSTHSKEGLGKKFIDNEKLWIKTEDMVRSVMQKEEVPFVEVPNEAAFYGPKIDVQIWSAIGREFTLATNQVDFAVPERFGLKYKDSDGTEKTPICIHRAPLGTHERTIGFLIEHYAGAFPAWLAPIQAMVLPISEKHKKYSDEVLKELIKQGIRAEIDESNETLGKRIRGSEMQKIPYILVVGEQEETNKTVAVRQREKGPTAQAENQGAMTTEAFAEMIKKQLPY